MIEVITIRGIEQVWIDGKLFATTEDPALAWKIWQAKKQMEKK